MTRIEINARSGALLAATMGAIYWLSSVPDRSGTAGAPLLRLMSNLLHVPVFALLAYCWLKTLAKDSEVSPAAIGLAFLGAGTCAVLDEWHQSFVTGRHASVGDLLLDLAGITGMLLILSRRSIQTARWRAGQ